MENDLRLIRAHYDETLLLHLRRYQDGRLPYGRQRPREDCMHVCWDLVRDLPCIACAGDDLDYAEWKRAQRDAERDLADFGGAA